MCELTHGMGTAWARHAMCESAFRDRIQTLMLLLHTDSGLNTNFGGGSFMNKSENIKHGG
jgi:hypothetical protein